MENDLKILEAKILQFYNLLVKANDIDVEGTSKLLEEYKTIFDITNNEYGKIE